MLRGTTSLGALAFSIIMGSAGLASAKCTVTLRFTNTDAHAVTMLGDESQARVNGGTYSKMGFNDVTVQPGATGSSSWTTDMSCGGKAKRDLRLRFQDSGDNNVYQKDVANLDVVDGSTYTYTIKND